MAVAVQTVMEQPKQPAESAQQQRVPGAGLRNSKMGDRAPWARRREGSSASSAISLDELQTLLVAATESGDSLAWLTAHASTYALLSSDEERALGETVRAGHLAAVGSRTWRASQAARERLIMANLRLVMRIAGGMRSIRGDLDVGDMVQDGVIGLMRAAERFDPAPGFRFSTYATWWITQAIQRGAAESAHPVRLPVYLFDRRRRMLRIRTRMLEELQREPRLDELAVACQRAGDADMDEALVALLLTCHAAVFSLEATRRPDSAQSTAYDDDLTLGAIVADPGAETSFEAHEQSADVAWLLEIAKYALGVRGDGKLQALRARVQITQLEAHLQAARNAYTMHMREIPTAATAKRHQAHARLLDREAQRWQRLLTAERRRSIAPRAYDIWLTRTLYGDEISLVELGKRYGITRERARQIELTANEKVRAALAEVGVRSRVDYDGMMTTTEAW